MGESVAESDGAAVGTALVVGAADFVGVAVGLSVGEALGWADAVGTMVGASVPVAGERVGSIVNVVG